MNVLIFPGGVPAALSFLAQAQASGARCIGASSLTCDPAAPAYAAWERLPWLGEADFAANLRAVVQRHDIEQIVSAHPAAAAPLREALQEQNRPLPVIEVHAANGSSEPVSATLARAEQLARQPLRLQLSGPAQPPLTSFELAGVWRQAAFIKGSSDEIKIEALSEIARWTPPGDLVEIGSAWGKSAFVLAWLSGQFQLGPLLCVDPWDAEIPLERGLGTALQIWAHGLNREAMFRDFTLALQPWTRHCPLNYLRTTSAQAWDIWQQQNFAVTSAEFGQTRYSGRLSLLHVDGHHDLEFAQQDIQLWTQRLQPGGWLIVDDYRWAFGSGPREAADAWLVGKETRVDCCFEAGSALFVRLKP